MNKTVNLEKFLHSNSSYLTGRPEGEDVRKILKLDEEDKNEKELTFIISDKVTGMNVSFFLELFSKSVKVLSEIGFRKKYKFSYENKEIKELVEEDIDYGINEALDDRDMETIVFGDRGNVK